MNVPLMGSHVDVAITKPSRNAATENCKNHLSLCVLVFRGERFRKLDTTVRQSGTLSPRLTSARGRAKQKCRHTLSSAPASKNSEMDAYNGRYQDTLAPVPPQN
jgi:hypothetical protein